MRAYTLSVLSQLANTGNPIIEKEIVQWVNNKLSSAGKTTSIRSFQDSSISDAKVVIDLVDSIKQGSINYELVKDVENDEVGFEYISLIAYKFLCQHTDILSLLILNLNVNYNFISLLVVMNIFSFQSYFNFFF